MYDIDRIKSALTGPIPSVSTPFKCGGEIDWGSLEGMIEFMIESGAPSLLITYGDSLLSVLTDLEVAQLIRFTVERARGRAMVIACGKPWWIGQTLEFIEYARGAGADLAIPVPPDWAQSCSDDALISFYTRVGKIMPFMVLTSLMSNRGVPQKVFEAMIKASTPGFSAVKDDVCGAYGRRLAALLNGRYGFLSGGLAENHMDVAPYGADGYLSVFMRFAPKLSRIYWDAYTAGDLAAAAKYISHYEAPYMAQAGALGLHFDALIRAALEIHGLCGRWRRNPYSCASDEQVAKLRAFFEEKGIL